MPRSKDLDTVAPDDPVETTKTVKTDKTSTEDCEQKAYSILGHTKTAFSSFLVNPKTFDFSERNHDEVILLALRPHWFTNVSWVLLTILMLFVPSIFKYFNFLGILPLNYQLAALLFWYLITFVFAFERFLGWYFDVYMVTNERVVDINFNNLLNKKFAEADLDMIQDVSSSVRGIAGTMFNYGDVLIQTASEVNEIHFEKVPNPEKIIKILQELREQHHE